MQLTSENYYSQEANQEYMSVSGYKDFAGTYGKMPCEFYGMEKLKVVIFPSAVISIRLSRIFFNESSLKFCKSLNAIPSKLFSSVASGRNPCTGHSRIQYPVINSGAL